MPSDEHELPRASSGEIRAASPGAAPASPGTYGQPPSGFRLPADTRLGPVRLAVADLDRSLAFYESVLGMRPSSRGPDHASLAAASDSARPLLELERLEGARPTQPYGRTGLFHFAILLPDRPSLGRFLAHADAIGLPLGAGDHLVSESLYLSDPDGLGIEVYADRPRERWRRIGRELMMSTDPLDLAGLRAAADGSRWTGMPPGTVIGHLHLRVGDLERAAEYYSAALGFDRQVWSYPGALFFGAGGYHHHLGTNIWAGTDATAPTDDEARLLEWTIELPDRGSLSRVADSLRGSGFEAQLANAGTEVLTRDPWGTGLRLGLV